MLRTLLLLERSIGRIFDASVVEALQYSLDPASERFRTVSVEGTFDAVVLGPETDHYQVSRVGESAAEEFESEAEGRLEESAIDVGDD